MRSFLRVVLDIYLYLNVNFVFQSAGINSSPDSSHFVRYHADDYLYGVSAPKIFWPPFAGRIHNRTNFCLLAEEFPFISPANLSAAEVV